MLDVDVSHDGATSTLRLSGELDISTAGTLASAFLALEEAGQRRVIVDLGAVDFVDVAGLRPIVKAATHGFAIRLRRPSAQASRLLQVSGLSGLLRVEGAS